MYRLTRGRRSCPHPQRWTRRSAPSSTTRRPLLVLAGPGTGKTTTLSSAWWTGSNVAARRQTASWC